MSDICYKCVAMYNFLVWTNVWHFLHHFGVQELTGFETLGFETLDDGASTSGTTEAPEVHSKLNSTLKFQ